MNTVYTFLADGFEEVEALAVVDCLVRAGLNSKTVSVNGSNTVTGAHNIKVVADIEFSEGDFSDADVLFFPGGMPGTLNLEAHSGLMNLLDKHYNPCSQRLSEGQEGNMLSGLRQRPCRGRRNTHRQSGRRVRKHSNSQRSGCGSRTGLHACGSPRFARESGRDEGSDDF